MVSPTYSGKRKATLTEREAAHDLTSPLPPDRQVHHRIKRRNLVVLAMLVSFIAFAFALSFSHVALEVGGTAKQTQN